MGSLVSKLNHKRGAVPDPFPGNWVTGDEEWEIKVLRNDINNNENAENQEHPRVDKEIRTDESGKNHRPTKTKNNINISENAENPKPIKIGNDTSNNENVENKKMNEIGNDTSNNENVENKTTNEIVNDTSNNENVENKTTNEIVNDTSNNENVENKKTNDSGNDTDNNENVENANPTQIKSSIGDEQIQDLTIFQRDNYGNIRLQVNNIGYTRNENGESGPPEVRSPNVNKCVTNVKDSKDNDKSELINENNSNFVPSEEGEDDSGGNEIRERGKRISFTESDHDIQALNRLLSKVKNISERKQQGIKVKKCTYADGNRYRRSLSPPKHSPFLNVLSRVQAPSITDSSTQMSLERVSSCERLTELSPSLNGLREDINDMDSRLNIYDVDLENSVATGPKSASPLLVTEWKSAPRWFVSKISNFISPPWQAPTNERRGEGDETTSPEKVEGDKNKKEREDCFSCESNVDYENKSEIDYVEEEDEEEADEWEEEREDMNEEEREEEEREEEEEEEAACEEDGEEINEEEEYTENEECPSCPPMEEGTSTVEAKLKDSIVIGPRSIKKCMDSAVMQNQKYKDTSKVPTKSIPVEDSPNKDSLRPRKLIGFKVRSDNSAKNGLAVAKVYDKSYDDNLPNNKNGAQEIKRSDNSRIYRSAGEHGYEDDYEVDDDDDDYEHNEDEELSDLFEGSLLTGKDEMKAINTKYRNYGEGLQGLASIEIGVDKIRLGFMDDDDTEDLDDFFGFGTSDKEKEAEDESNKTTRKLEVKADGGDEESCWFFGLLGKKSDDTKKSYLEEVSKQNEESSYVEDTLKRISEKLFSVHTKEEPDYFGERQKIAEEPKMNDVESAQGDHLGRRQTTKGSQYFSEKPRTTSEENDTKKEETGGGYFSWLPFSLYSSETISKVQEESSFSKDRSLYADFDNAYDSAGDKYGQVVKTSSEGFYQDSYHQPFMSQQTVFQVDNIVAHLSQPGNFNDISPVASPVSCVKPVNYSSAEKDTNYTAYEDYTTGPSHYSYSSYFAGSAFGRYENDSKPTDMRNPEPEIKSSKETEDIYS